MQEGNIKILFVIRNAAHIPYFESLIRALLGRGYHLRLLFDKKWSKGRSIENALRPFQAYGALIEGRWACTRSGFLRNILFYTREILNYRRYLIWNKIGESPYYDRWEKYLPPGAQTLLKWSFVRGCIKQGWFGSLLRFFDHGIPPGRSIQNDIKEFAPSLVLASPTNLRFSSADLEYLKAARWLGILSIVPVISWDNLTTKGIFHILPNRVFVWNETQHDDLVRYHGIPSEDIYVTGSLFFDVWFTGMNVVSDRETFCARYGLHNKDPIVLYVGSSITATAGRSEVWLVEKLRQKLDQSSDPALQRIQIVVRPHPANSEDYHKFEGQRGIAVVPRLGDYPDIPGARQLFYDTLKHSVCAVGINTSGMIDAVLVGTPVIALMPAIYKNSQAVMEHFQYFLKSGAAEDAKTIEECLGYIQRILKGEDRSREGRLAFIRQYIRPRGVETPAGEYAAREIEHMLAKRNTH